MSNHVKPTKRGAKEPAGQSVGTGLEALGSGLNAIGSGLETLGSGIYAVWQGWFGKDEAMPDARPRRSSLASPEDVRNPAAPGESTASEADAERAREAEALASLNIRAKVRVLDANDGVLPAARRRR